LERAGLVVEAGEEWFAASTVDAAISALGSLLDTKPGGFTVGEARDCLGTTRRHVLPLLGYLDSIGVTARRGDLRVAGRRLANGRLGPQ
jgi:hypothetical protein